MITNRTIRRVTHRLTIRRTWQDLTNLLTTYTLAYLISAACGAGEALLPTHPALFLLSIAICTGILYLYNYRRLHIISQAAARAYSNPNH